MTDSGRKILLFGRKWLPHILFCCILIYIFPHISGMRPVLHWIPYKERLAAVIVLILLYSHYLFFIPHYLIQSRYVAYSIYAITTIITGVFLELIVVGPDLIRDLYNNFPQETTRCLLLSCFINVFFRDAALLAFIILLALYQHATSSIHNLQKRTARQMKVICVKDKDNNNVFLSIPEIIYCQQKRNYTHVYTAQQEYRMRSSLRQTCDTLGDDCVQVSRHQAVMRPHIVERDQNYFMVEDKDNPDGQIKIMISQGFQTADSKNKN